VITGVLLPSKLKLFNAPLIYSYNPSGNYTCLLLLFEGKHECRCNNKTQSRQNADLFGGLTYLFWLDCIFCWNY
jgi:hypothetical protein